MPYIKEHKWSIAIAAISILIIAAVAFLLFHHSTPAPTGSGVTVTIDAPQQTGSGSEIDYTVTVDNGASTAITGVKVSMIYPQGFTFEESTPNPSALNGSEFDISEIAPGQSPTIMIKGTISGNAGETKTVSAVARYSYTNFNSQFVSQGQARTQIANSTVALNFSGPTSPANSQSVTYTLSYQNVTAQAIQNATLKITIPTGFTLQSSSPQLDPSNTLAIAFLAANDTESLTLNGQFTGVNSGTQESFAAEFDAPDSSGNTLAAATAAYQVTVTKTPLQLTATVSDQTSGGSQSLPPNIVLPGDNLSYDVHYVNNASIPATGAVITATLTGVAVDQASIKAQGANIQASTVTWDGSQNSALVSLQPNASGDFHLQFQVANPATHGTDTDMQIGVSFSITSNEYQQGFTVAAPAQQVQTVAAIGGSAAFASGSNPPMAGQYSTYTMTLTLRNSTNDIKNGVLTVALPNATGFDKTTVNASEYGNVSFNQTTRTLTWNLGTIPAHTGDFTALRKLQFSLTVQASQANIGNYVTLTHNAAFTGTDSYTNQTVSASLNDLTTNDAGTGTVVAAQ